MPEKQQPSADEASKMAYQQVCSSYHAIDDFRARLLGLLPLASGVGIFLLLGDNLADQTKRDFVVQFLGPIGGFGGAVTFALFLYELRGIQKCNRLITVGRLIESALDVDGQFTHHPRDFFGFIGKPFAACMIYWAVLAAWIFLALVVCWPQDAHVIAITIFIVGAAGSYLLYCLKLKPELKDGPNVSAILGTILTIIPPDLQATRRVEERMKRLRARMEDLSRKKRVPTHKDWQELNELMEGLAR